MVFFRLKINIKYYFINRHLPVSLQLVYFERDDMTCHLLKDLWYIKCSCEEEEMCVCREILSDYRSQTLREIKLRLQPARMRLCVYKSVVCVCVWQLSSHSHTHCAFTTKYMVTFRKRFFTQEKMYQKLKFWNAWLVLEEHWEIMKVANRSSE